MLKRHLWGKKQWQNNTKNISLWGMHIWKAVYAHFYRVIEHMYDNSHDKKILQCLTCSLIISLPFILQKIKKNPFTSYCDNIMATVVTTIKSAKEVLASLRKEPFCIEYVEKLVNHRVVQVSKAGTLPLKVMAAFLCEQYYIVSADIRSMEHLVSMQVRRQRRYRPVLQLLL